jgi:hypothetical protein
MVALLISASCADAVEPRRDLLPPLLFVDFMDAASDLSGLVLPSFDRLDTELRGLSDFPTGILDLMELRNERVDSRVSARSNER